MGVEKTREVGWEKGEEGRRREKKGEEGRRRERGKEVLHFAGDGLLVIAEGASELLFQWRGAALLGGLPL